MSELTNDMVAEFVGNLTVLELISLTRELEQKWGVEAKPQMVQQVTVETPEPPKPEKTEFDVILVSYPADKKMTVVKLVREVMGLGILDSKNLVESLPKPLKENLSKDDAEALKARFVEVGSVVEVK
jgi:large subunit ribosomal protein L7/L12